MTYHVLIGAEQTGLFEEAVVAAMIARGEVTPTTYVWTADMSDWTVAGSVAALSGYFDEAAPAAGVAAGHSDGGVGQRLRIWQSIATAAKAFVRQPGRLIVIAVAYTVLGLIIGLPSLAFIVPFILAAAESSGDFVMPDMGVWFVLGFVVTFVASSALHGGINTVLLDGVRGERMRLARLIVRVPKIVILTITFVISALVACILAGVIAVLIYAADSGWPGILSLPLIFILFTLYFSVFFVIDAGKGPVAALGNCVVMVARLGWWRMVAAFLLLALIYIVLSLVIGIVVAVLAMIGMDGMSGAAMLGGDMFGGMLSSPLAIAAFAIRMLLTMLAFMFAMTVCAAIYEQGRAAMGLEVDRG